MALQIDKLNIFPFGWFGKLVDVLAALGGLRSVIERGDAFLLVRVE
ncbi:hypothetical protein [Massilia antarctica]|nr:hypothetical protein [Massilia antarctica]